MAGSGFSNYFEGQIAAMATGQATTVTLPITPYIALFTVAPNDDGTGGTEVTGGGYSRKSASGKFGAPVLGDPTTVTNSAIIDFGTASAGWGLIVACAIYDAATGGNMIMTGALATSKTINNGDPCSYAIGTFQLQLA